MAGATTPVRVLVVDDHRPFRDAARAVVDATPGFESVGEAACGTEGLELAARLAPDLVLIDAEMPEPDGIETAHRLAAADAGRLVVLVSIDPDCPAASALVCAGAAVFVPKQALRPAVLAAVWEAHGGHPPGVTPIHPAQAESHAEDSTDPKGEVG
jgi:DNA-binding NarL/FixJ family response regulator